MKKIATLLLGMCGTFTVYSQGIAVNADGSNPDTSAIFDIKSTTKGLLIPRMTEAQRNAIVQPASGLLIYQVSNDSGFYYRRGGAWQPMADNLGNHWLNRNLITDGKYISRSGDNVGILPMAYGAVRFYGNNFLVNTPTETARIDEYGAFAAFGSLGNGFIPATGNGSRMMWYPFKSSFRAGAVDGGTGAWDDANTGYYSVGFGINAKASGNYAFSEGYGTSSTATASVAMGYSSTATGNYSFAMGYQSEASDITSVALGYQAKATGDYTVALGYRANANGWSGGFTASDASSTTALLAAGSNRFTTRYAGGYFLYSNAATTLGVTVPPGGNSWNSISDSTKKERFLAADGELFLHKLRNLRLGSWNYKVQRAPQFRHYGPMAQEFHAAFGKDAYGTIGCDTTIGSADMDGVLMIMVKALEQRTASLQAENELLKKQVATAGKTTEEWKAFKSLMADNKAAKVFMDQVSQLAAAREAMLADNNNHLK